MQFADSKTGTVYEHATRALKVDGVTLCGYNKASGGGNVRTGQTHMKGAAGVIRGASNGIAEPQEMTIEFHVDTWLGIVQPALKLKATASGIFGEDAHERVDITIVDGWTSPRFGEPSAEGKGTFRIKSAKPMTSEDGKPFFFEVVLFPVALYSFNYGI